MRQFKPIKKLDEIKDIAFGEIIGIGQGWTETIPAKCIYNDGNEMKFLGNIKHAAVVDYKIKIEYVESIKEDGSIPQSYCKESKIIEPGEKGYEERRDILIKVGIWDQSQENGAEIKFNIK